jgi:CHAT domain-containing protein
MLGRGTLVGLLLSATPLLFAAAPPLGPDRPLTVLERKELAGLGQQAFAQYQQQLKAGRLKEAIESAKQIVVLEEKLSGARTGPVARWLAWIAEASRRVGADEQAIAYAERAYRLRLRLHPEGHWRVIDARLEVEESRNQARRDEAARQQLRKAEGLNGQVVRLWQQGKAKEALPLARQALALRRKLLGEKHRDTAMSLFNLGAQYKALQQLHQAEDCYLRARAIRKEVLGEKHPDYATGLHNLALLYLDMGEYARARPLFEETLAISKEVQGEKHPNYALSLNNLALRYQAMGDYSRARSLCEQALALSKEVLGEKHPLYAISLNNLAGLYTAMGEYGRARSLCEQALTLHKELLGEKHRDYAHSLNNLANLYQEMGEYARARSLYEQALAIHKEVQGEKHPDYASSLNNLAGLYHAMGEYGRARTLCEQALALRKELLGEKHPAYASSLHNLAHLYQAMGESGRARTLYEQALALRKEVQGEKHPAYAVSLNNLANLYQAREEYGRARPLYEQALALTKEVLGEKHPHYANSLHNLASLYQAMGEYGRARSLFEQALALRKEVVGEKHPDYANSLNNLAYLYLAMGEYDRARALLEQALALRKDLVGENHPHYAASLANLVLLAWQEGKPAAASKQLAQALQIVHQHLESTFSALSARQRLQLLAQSRRYLNDYLSVSVQARLPPAEVYQAVLAWKGVAGARAAEEQLLRDHPALASLLDQLRQKRAGLAHLSAHLPSPANRTEWSGRYRDLDREREELEFRLAEKSAAFRSLRSPQSKAVATALPARCALVDLLEYWHRTPNPEHPGKWLWERRLVAFVVVKDKEVVRVDLGVIEPLVQAVAAWRLTMQTLSPVDEKAAAQLRSLLWDKLAPSLAGCETVLVCPDGVLCSLPWAALPGSKPGSFLIEEVALGQIPSARQLLWAADRAGSSGLLALGGLDYGKSAEEGKGWGPLPGTGLEARALVGLHQERFPTGRPARLLAGAAVDKAALAAALSPGKGELRWRQVHLATHGYFQQQGKAALALAGRGVGERTGLPAEEAASMRLDPLLGCGLVLSGANQDNERGTLTALEVSNLDLRGCEVLVLSACETGLGKTEGGEGVLGLQSAFHLAGARTVVASLWSVSDPATSVLMEQFYKNLWADRPLSRLEALRQAQLFVLKNPEVVRQRAQELKREVVKAGRGTVEQLRGKGKEVEIAVEKDKPQTLRSHPAWWAPFVLSGDIGPLPR